MPLGGTPNEREEKQRVCPHCREMISILAVKCRHCGEEVGKPKEETRVLSLDDLGGETVYHEAPPESVMEAMEMFRTEISGKKSPDVDAESPSSGGGVDASGMPVLDDANRDFMETSFASASSQTGKKESSWKERLATAGKAIAVALVILFVLVKGTQWVRASIENKNDTAVDYVNQAPALMAQNAEPIAALEAAYEAKRRADTAENRKIYEEAIAYVTDHVEELLTADVYDPLASISEASRIASRAANTAPDALGDLKRKVDQDNTDYRIGLLSIDASKGEAIFKPITQNAREITVRKGDTLLERFRITDILSDRVNAEDIQRRNRRVRFQKRGVSGITSGTRG